MSGDEYSHQVDDGAMQGYNCFIYFSSCSIVNSHQPTHMAYVFVCVCVCVWGGCDSR